jgi:hypothetical protein
MINPRPLKTEIQFRIIINWVDNQKIYWGFITGNGSEGDWIMQAY